MSGRDLRVSQPVGAAIRLGLAEIVQRLASSSPLSTEEAVEHVKYELGVLQDHYVTSEKVANGNKSKEQS